MTAPITAIDLFNLLRAKLGEQEAQALTAYITDEVERNIEARKGVLVTKDDIATVKKEIADLRVEMKEQKAELIKWMFIFWIGQIGATIGIVLLFLKK